MKTQDQQNTNITPNLAQRASKGAGKLAAIGGLSLAMMIPAVSHAGSHYDRARVLSAVPVYDTVSYSTPVEACRQQTVAVPRKQRGATAPILGAIIGGAIGNAVGHSKRNKQVGTVVGAVLGGSIGADVARNGRRHHDDVRYEAREICDTQYQTREEQVLSHYDVTYKYAGSTYQTRMDRDPGNSLRVRVRVSPAG